MVGAPEVWNKKEPYPTDSVYIGRPSKWGNPFIIGKHGNRNEVIAAYRKYIEHSPKLLADLSELRGRHLVCWCSPLPCHGHVLLELANK